MITQNIHVPHNFNSKIYLSLNYDLSHLSEDQAAYHYHYHGYYEKRKYTIVPDDFDYKIYLKLNPDIKADDEMEAMLHYANYGYYENRKYVNDYTDLNNTNDSYTLDFFEKYHTSLDDLKTHHKMKFRYICYKYIPYIRNITLPMIPEKSSYEAVLVEYRCFPHIEFIIRNNILKLGSQWCFTIVCGIANYDFMLNMCKTISQNINVIKTNYTNITVSEYSELLSNTFFWNLLTGKKILIYQEDSIIFKNNVDDFLYFDYIGAPWITGKNDNKLGVGNGGISLRTRDIMIQIIEMQSIHTTVFNTSTLEYMQQTNSTVPPEDVYFSKNMEDLKIGILSDRKSATKFSSESIFNVDSFAGHCFWISDPNWIKKIKKYNVIQFKPNYDLGILEHRGGWKYVLTSLKENFFFSKTSDIDFFDMIEHKFLWNKQFICTNKWCGIIHCTPKTPDYLKVVNLECMFENPNFITSLNSCIFIVTLSPYVTKYLKKKIKCDLNLDVPIYTLMHPVVAENIPLFSVDDFIMNENKLLIQVGQQLRKTTSIYRLNNIPYGKLWLTGTQDFYKIKGLFNKETLYLKLTPNDLNTPVLLHYTKTFEEYDLLLSKNVVFVDFFDAAANNTVLECIIRNTPIIVNKIEGIVDYLGDDYPLYYTHLGEVTSLLSITKITEAHNYLMRMDKTPFMINTFLKGLFDIVNKHCLQYH
uniref:DUF5672 domain-containing protein n=1 Tax=viral metagenome TaxID=1070528 RepID=A0A6C0E181_9ZZZZ